MLSFQQFILESPYEIGHYDIDDHILAHGKGNTTLKKTSSPKTKVYTRDSTNYKEVGTSPEHKIYRHVDKVPGSNKAFASFIAVHKKTKKIHMKVDGNFNPKSKEFEVHDLRGNPKTTIKAHDFYHHLILAGHVNKLVSDKTQSLGGKKTWHRLTSKPNIKMSASDGEYHKNFNDNYTSVNWNGNKTVYDKLKNKKLIAKADYK